MDLEAKHLDLNTTGSSKNHHISLRITITLLSLVHVCFPRYKLYSVCCKVVL